MDKTMLIYGCGIYSLFFALFHLSFWKIFRWDKELKKLHPVNSAVMQILNLRIIHLLFFVAFLCFFYPQSLYNTELGKVLLVGFSLFWLGRTVEQVIFFKFDQPAIYIFTGLFIIGTVIFLLPVL